MSKEEPGVEDITSGLGYLQEFYRSAKEYVWKGGLLTEFAGTKEEIDNASKNVHYADYGFFDALSMVALDGFFPLLLAHEYFPNTNIYLSPPVVLAIADSSLKILRQTWNKNSRYGPGIIGTTRELATYGIKELKERFKK